MCAAGARQKRHLWLLTDIQRWHTYLLQPPTDRAPRAARRRRLPAWVSQSAEPGRRHVDLIAGKNRVALLRRDASLGELEGVVGQDAEDAVSCHTGGALYLGDVKQSGCLE